MRITFFILFAAAILCSSCEQRITSFTQENTKLIQDKLLQLADHIRNKRQDSVLFLFAQTDGVLFIGSDSSEVCHGINELKVLVKKQLSQPYIFAFDLHNATISTNGNTSWAFVNGSVDIITAGAKTIHMPYRLTTVWLKQKDTWKIVLFNGSVPGKG